MRLLWKAGLKEDLEEQIGLPRQLRETMFARLMEQLEQNPRDEEGGRRSEQVARMENARGFVIGEEIEVGVKLGYIKALFSLSKVTLKQVPAGSAAIISSRYNI